MVAQRQARSWPFWTILAGLSSAVFATFYSGFVKFSAPSMTSTDFALRTEMILKTTPLIDGHNDLTYLLRIELQNKIYDNTTFTFRNGNLQNPPV